MSSSPTPPSRSESITSRLKFRNPARSLTLGPRSASPSTTPGRTTPSRSNTRDSSTPPPTTRSRSSILPSAFQRRASATIAPSSTKAASTKASSTKAGSSKAPSSEAVNELGAKVSEPAATTEQAPTESRKDDADVFGHSRILSGSTIESEPPMTPPPTQTAEPMSIPKSEDPASDSPVDGASISSSRSPSRLRRQVSNLSRHSVSGSIRRLSLLGPSSPPQAETAPVHAQGEMQTSLSRTPSVSSLRRHASPEPIAPKARESMSTPEPLSEVEAPQPPSEPTPQPAPEAEAAQPEAAQTQPEAAPAETETQASKVEAQPEVQPSVISTPPKEATPAPSVKAPSTSEAPASKPAEPQTPVKPFLSRSASKSSLTRSPTPDRPEPKRRGTLANWARKSIDRRPSVSGSRPASRGPAEDEPPSDTESVKERERKWGTGLPVPNPPTPKKSEDNIKRRFSLGRRQSENTKSPNESSSETDKKSGGWSKMMRAVSKSKKEKEKGDGSSITPEASSLDVATEPTESRPSLVIPERMYSEQRPLSAIVESPAVALNPHMLAGAQSPEQVMGAPVPAAVADSPVVVKAETTSPELSPVIVDINSDTSGIDSGMENLPALTAVAAEVQPTPEATIVEEPEPSVEVEQPKDEAPAPTEEVQETPATVEEVAAPEPGTSTPPVVETTSAPVENTKSPVSPTVNATTEREIARARSPRQSNGGPSTSNRRGSPAPSIIGVKRKHMDEPTEVGKARVRYLPGEYDSEPEPNTASLNVDENVDWAVSPAIQLAVTLSLVLPRRKRDVANPTNRKRGGWWPMRRGARTEIRFNAIRGVNEEVPIASKSWVVPAAVRTTAKVVTAPARRGDIEWGPVTDSDNEDPEDESPRRFEFSLSPSPEPDWELPR